MIRFHGYSASPASMRLNEMHNTTDYEDTGEHAVASIDYQ